MVKCVVSGCPSRLEVKGLFNRPQKRFFNLPRDPAKVKVWLAALRETDKLQDVVQDNHIICEDHFLPEHITPRGISDDAVPLMPPYLDGPVGSMTASTPSPWGAEEPEEIEEEEEAAAAAADDSASTPVVEKQQDESMEHQSVATTDGVEPPSVAKTESMEPPSVAKTESKEAPSVAKTESKEAPSVAKTESMEAPSVAKTESMEPSSVTKTESMEAPSVATTDGVEPPSVAKTESMEPPSVAKTESMQPPSVATKESTELLSVATTGSAERQSSVATTESMEHQSVTTTDRFDVTPKPPDPQTLEKTLFGNAATKEMSFMRLTRRLMELLCASPDGVVDLCTATVRLQAARSRLNDITGVLAAFKLIARNAPNKIQWIAESPVTSYLGKSDHAVQEELNNLKLVEETLDALIKTCAQQLFDMTDDTHNTQSAYVTHEDIRHIPVFQGQTVLVVKAPEETKLEVPTPTEDSIQVHLKAGKGPITVLTCEMARAGQAPPTGGGENAQGCFLHLEESRIKTHPLHTETQQKVVQSA